MINEASALQTLKENIPEKKEVPKKVAIIDLDYTLFDTASFKQDLARVIGLTVPEFGRIYQEQFKNRGINYNFNRQIEALLEQKIIKPSDADVINERLEEFASHSSAYLFPEAKKILETLRDKGYEIILASFGDPSFQRIKIDNLNEEIKGMFYKILITEKDKSQVLQDEIGPESEVLIINDNASESKKIQEAIGKGEVVIINNNGGYMENTEHSFDRHNLEDYLESLKKAA